VGSWLPFVVFVVIVGGLLLFAGRARRRQRDAEQVRTESITVGTEVMTTSGLYGTVVARHDDDSVQLRIAPGVEVRWAFAALRDAASLPPAYRPVETAEQGETPPA
jgi:preprotein translocase subunit YajC